MFFVTLLWYLYPAGGVTALSVRQPWIIRLNLT